jgi:hypothetical protein
MPLPLVFLDVVDRDGLVTEILLLVVAVIVADFHAIARFWSRLSLLGPGIGGGFRLGSLVLSYNPCARGRRRSRCLGPRVCGGLGEHGRKGLRIDLFVPLWLLGLALRGGDDDLPDTLDDHRAAVSPDLIIEYLIHVATEAYIV